MSYEENRVKVKVYGSLPRNSKLLVPVPGVKDKIVHLHVVVAAAFTEMAKAAKADLDIDLALASAWRKHRWKSKADYDAKVIAKYGSVKEGRKWLAYSSPHETGLALDLGVGGLWPDRKTAEAQKKQPLHLWLVEHAYEYGWHPYKREPWHWECPLSIEAYRSGVVEEDDPGPPQQVASFGLGGEEEDECVEDMESFEFEDEEQ